DIARVPYQPGPPDSVFGQTLHILRHLQAGQQFDIALRAGRVAHHLHAHRPTGRRKLGPLADKCCPRVLFIRETSCSALCAWILLKVGLATFADIICRYLIGTRNISLDAERYRRNSDHYSKFCHVRSPSSELKDALTMVQLFSAAASSALSNLPKRDL